MQQFLLDGFREVHKDKMALMVKVVLAALIDDAKVALPRRVLIGDGSIDLV